MATKVNLFLQKLAPKRWPVWILVILLGLLQGVLYLYLLPPWQHYDEPNHFEVAWLVAHLDHWPRPGDLDAGMRRAVFESMWRNDFFGKNQTPPVLAADQAPGIGVYAQLDEPPLYYFLASLPLRLVKSQAIETQLYAVRWVSLLLYLVSLLAVWGSLREITRPGNMLRWLAPISLALMPGFTELMTAANNDAAAVALLTLFFWGSLRLIRRGVNLVDFAWAGVTAGLAIFTKNTALVAAPLFLLAILLAALRRKAAGQAWSLRGGVFLAVGAMLGLVGIGLAVFSWGDPWLWARTGAQVEPMRLSAGQTMSGQAAANGSGTALIPSSAVFRLEFTPADNRPENVQLQQLLQPEAVRSLVGKQATLGVWMWADRPTQALLPMFIYYDGATRRAGVAGGRLVSLTTSPQFFAFSFRPRGDFQRAWLQLAPFPEGAQAGLQIYYDGLVLAIGRYPKQAPVFADLNARSGLWGQAAFSNLVRNASAESGGPRLRPWVDRLVGRVFQDPGVNQPSITLYTLADWSGAGNYYQYAAVVLNSSFWGRFGWGHVRLAWEGAYTWLAVLGLTGLLGAAVRLSHAVLRPGRNFPWPALAVLALGLAFLWGLTLVRGSNYLLRLWRVYYPVARYAYPVILPTWLGLTAGWLGILSLPERWLRAPAWLKGVILLVILSLLNGLALWSIYHVYS